MPSLPEQIVYTGKMMFKRRLTDIAGGNISARQGEIVYITPRYAGSRQHWQLDPADILSGSLNDPEFEADPRLTREAGVHLSIYRAFPTAGAVIHAHAYHIQPFAAAQKPIEPVLEHTQKYGVIPLTRYSASHTPELGGYVVEALRSQEANLLEHAAAALIPTHGIVVVSRDLLAALDALERIDWNAWCLLAGRLI